MDAIILRILALIVSAGAYFLAAGTYSFPLFLWIAPLPLLLLAYIDKKSYFLPVVFAAYFLGNFLALYFCYHETAYPFWYELPSLCIEAVIMSAIVMISRFLVLQTHSLIAIFAFPLFFVSYSYLSVFLSHGRLTNLSIGSQVKLLPVVQISSLTGPWGIIFITSLFPAALAAAWVYRKRFPKQAYNALFTLAAFLLVDLGFGSYQLSKETNDPVVKVGLAAHNPLKWGSSDGIEAYLKRIDTLAGMGAKFILQPEMGISISTGMENEVLGQLSHAAIKNRVTVLAAVLLINRPIETNSLVVFSPEGKLVARYDKMHLVSGIEKGFTPGKQLAAFSLPQGLAGLAICHDMDYLNPARQYSREGIGLLFVPAADFGVDADGMWHQQFSILQSIQGGFSLARAAFYGFLSASDYRGRILAEKRTVVGEDVFLTADVPMGKGATFYSLARDWFAWLSLLLTLLFGIKAFNKIRV